MLAYMLIVGKLTGKIDRAHLLGVGFSITAFSLWQMANFTLDLGAEDRGVERHHPGYRPGPRLRAPERGHVRHPVAEMRAERHNVNLMRIIGNQHIGIALVQTLLVRNTQIAAHLGGALSIANLFHAPAIASVYNLGTSTGMAALNGEITRKRTSMIAYLDDFWMMMWLTILVLPLLL